MNIFKIDLVKNRLPVNLNLTYSNFHNFDKYVLLNTFTCFFFFFLLFILQSNILCVRNADRTREIVF